MSLPQEPSVEEDPTETVTEMTGEIAPWSSMDIALEGWSYRIWDKWINKDEKVANVLLDVLRQYDPTATMTVEKSQTVPDSPDNVYVYRFSLYGSPDGLMEAITAIEETFIGATENYKVIAGQPKVILTYADGHDELAEVPSTAGADIDEALRLAIDAAYKRVGAKTEEEGVITVNPLDFGGINFNSYCNYCEKDFSSSSDLRKHMGSDEFFDEIDNYRKSHPTEDDSSTPTSSSNTISQVYKIVCPSCGAPIDATKNDGQCEYCGGNYRIKGEEETWHPDYQAIPKATIGDGVDEHIENVIKLIDEILKL
jgi:rubrerythrin